MNPGTGMAAASCSSAMVCFAVKTLPLVQWVAGAVAIVAGVVAIAWTIYKFVRAYRDGGP